LEVAVTDRNKIAAGLLVYRKREGQLEVLLVHPGGPFWKNKDEGAWSIPKGEPNPNEDLLATAQRELTEETGLVAPGPFTPLVPIRQSSGKLVHAWATPLDLDWTQFTSNTFQLQWPPRSGKYQEFPEVDRIAYFPIDEARNKILAGQVGLLDEVVGICGS
jgi:predicted NUDIX family NTP pyrophosphohydrolase